MPAPASSTGCCASACAPAHRTLANTTLQGLRNGSATVRLRSGAARSITLDAWIPDGTNDYEGRHADVELTPTLRPAG